MHGIGGHHRPMVAADSTTPRRAKKVRNLSTARLTRFLAASSLVREHRRLPAGCALRITQYDGIALGIAEVGHRLIEQRNIRSQWNPIQRRW